MANEVTCRVLAPILEAIEKKGLPPEIWLKDIPYSAAHLHNKHERIDWPAYCRLLQNLRPAFSDEDFAAIGRSWATSPLFRPWALFTRLLFDAGKKLQWIEAAMWKLGHHYFSCIDFNLDEFGPHGFKVTLRVKDDYEFCREHFLFVRGAMDFLPGLERYLKVNVKMEWIEGGAVFENVYATPLKTPSWLYRKILWMFSSRSVVQEIIESHDALLERYRELEEARREQKILSYKLIEAQEAERKRISGELHDEVGGNLGSIALIGDMLESKLSLNDEERKSLKQISGIARATSDAIHDIVWFINPENDSMAMLLIKMRDAANLVLEPLDFSFTAPEQGILPEADLHFRRNLYLIYKECLQNIVKHARASKVEIEIRESEGCLRLRVSDDGSGFDAAQSYPGDGLKNIKRRAAELGATVEIISGAGKGATVTVSAKIP